MFITPISSRLRLGAMLAPHMGGMVARNGAWATSKGGRMKYHGTAPAYSAAPYCNKASRPICPRCRDLIIAATQSQHVNRNEIRHWWACEACGYEFCTTVRWMPSFAEGRQPSADETRDLPRECEPVAAWRIRGDTVVG